MATDTDPKCWEITPVRSGHCYKLACTVHAPANASLSHSPPSTLATNRWVRNTPTIPKCLRIFYLETLGISVFTASLIKHCSGSPIYRWAEKKNKVCYPPPWPAGHHLLPLLHNSSGSPSSSRKRHPSLQPRSADSGSATVLLLTSGLPGYIWFGLWKRGSDGVGQSPGSRQHSPWSLPDSTGELSGLTSCSLGGGQLTILSLCEYQSHWPSSSSFCCLLSHHRVSSILSCAQASSPSSPNEHLHTLQTPAQVSLPRGILPWPLCIGQRPPLHDSMPPCPQWWYSKHLLTGTVQTSANRTQTPSEWTLEQETGSFLLCQELTVEC